MHISLHLLQIKMHPFLPRKIHLLIIPLSMLNSLRKCQSETHIVINLIDYFSIAIQYDINFYNHWMHIVKIAELK